ncbi:MAG: AI-2E family transporter [Acidaminococcus sp.]|jgi:predicted PurR-regulated permease PerM|nr:AI-2E family transporter [Acidaminococcus sp.]MCI2100129.1 AI-2E family transporter [Acidaminococcus sp.]MCI2114448.1 AI-2E family transporter [Acidaminococcus sp.]MCI2116383.1 AI-2E family transporter [Acidaminococcus sp.]
MEEGKSRSLIFKSAVALGAFAIFCVVTDFLLPVFVSIAFSFLLYPIVRRLEKIRIKGKAMPSVIAVLLAFLIFGAFIAFALHVLMIPLMNQINTLTKALPGLAAAASNTIHMFFGEEAQSQMPPNIKNLLEQALSTVGGYAMSLAQKMLIQSVQFARSMVSMALVPFLTFYFLKDWRTLKDMLVDVFPYNKQALANQVLGDIGNMLCLYVDNMLKLSLVAAACLTIGNYILGVQYTLVLGVLGLVTEMIPLVGSVVGTITAVLIALLQEPSLALKVLILYIVYYQIDAQVIMPNLVGKAITLHPVLVILAVIIGGKLSSGPIGLLFAVPVLAIIKILYTYFWHSGEEKVETETVKKQ